MLRPILAFLTLTLAAFLLAPTVSSVHHKITDLHFDHQTPWELFRWTDDPTPTLPIPDCGRVDRHLYSEITQWPARIKKDEPFTLRGFVGKEEDNREGIAEIDVDIFLNETKTEPGVFLGEAQSGSGGFFTLLATVPFDLGASHYHIVAHAKQKVIDCSTYFEHWSDPETDVVSNTTIEWDPVEHAVVGREMVVTGHVLDAVRAPVRSENVTVTWNGQERKVKTDANGAFSVNLTPSKAGELTFTATYKGGYYYEGTRGETVVDVATEDFELSGDDPIRILRNQTTAIAGQIHVADDVRGDNVTIRFNGTRIATCPTCETSTSIQAPVADDGSFSVSFVVPSSVEPGVGVFTVSGGGLKKTYPWNFTVDVPTTLVLEASGTGLFSKGYAVNASLYDEAGRPLAAPLALHAPDGWTTNESGVVALEGKASCGRYPVQASFNGSERVLPATAQKEMLVCGWLAFVPPWLLAIPWWVWPLAAVAAFAAWRLVKSLRQRFSPVIASGPPLTLLFTEPSDDAQGFASVGEPVVATAFLESPLPDGHALRMGTSRETAERPLDAELRAHLRLVPDKMGDVPIRAEIVDPRGQVVTRRTIHLKVVRYAEEIERRYLELRAAHGAKEHVTPREFERWLREQAPGLDHEVARRLVHVFEEADYSPRAAGRAEFAAYLQAEHGVKEVTRDVSVR